MRVKSATMVRISTVYIYIVLISWLSLYIAIISRSYSMFSGVHA